MKYQARLTLASPGLCVRLAQGLPLVKPCGITARSEWGVHADRSAAPDDEVI